MIKEKRQLFVSAGNNDDTATMEDAEEIFGEKSPF